MATIKDQDGTWEIEGNLRRLVEPSKAFERQSKEVHKHSQEQRARQEQRVRRLHELRDRAEAHLADPDSAPALTTLELHELLVALLPAAKRKAK